ncbi:MAG: 2-C-methyl-D-erythritol 2,4-cyclodiphosphate synthase [Actinomycetia bacterium]|nr:2-C-methyl-D-erythritol 2,4-cyclodiphosphate synthase [Actinomycetes bacterium]
MTPNTRIGIGVDVHRFDPDVPLWLAGLHWPDEVGLAGHSDADVVAHSMCDALLSGAGLGDLGAQFGTDDPQWANASGTRLLAETVSRLSAAGAQTINVSCQIIGNRPRFSGRRTEAQEILSQVCHCPVTVSATTTDGLGLTGRGEGIAAISTALVTVTL